MHRMNQNSSNEQYLNEHQGCPRISYHKMPTVLEEEQQTALSYVHYMGNSCSRYLADVKGNAAQLCVLYWILAAKCINQPTNK